MKAQKYRVYDEDAEDVEDEGWSRVSVAGGRLLKAVTGVALSLMVPTRTSYWAVKGAYSAFIPFSKRNNEV